MELKIIANKCYRFPACIIDLEKVNAGWVISNQTWYNTARFSCPVNWCALLTVALDCAWQSSSVIRRKGESQNGCFKKTKHTKFFEKRTFLPSDTPPYVCVSGGKKCSFFENFGVLCFLETPVLRFGLLPFYRRVLVIRKGYIYKKMYRNEKLILHNNICPITESYNCN